MRSVNSGIYNKDYYQKCCTNFLEFLRSAGESQEKRVEYLKSLITVERGMKILDIGCGNGEFSFWLAKNGADVIGIDYSNAAITIAEKKKSKLPKNIKQKIKFIKKDVKKIKFAENYFDMVVAVDIFEHLYPEEVEILLDNISKTLKPNGILFIHTEANKFYLDYAHKYYIYPISNFLIKINKIITKKTYPGLPKNPRNEFHKKQHVNEPTYFYLKKIFTKHDFHGKIIGKISLLKQVLGWKDFVYNVFVLFYPFCYLPPFNLFFVYDFVCVLKNKKIN
ncbi:MAG: class I SAM-dependent methyltransferase [Cyanobacteria bacterium]|nr:class I SAM-dependent methyltransferase [Cyanobacteriota bacterium]